MTEIKRYDVNKANMIGLVRFDEKESGRWVKHDDHVAIVAALQEQVLGLKERLQLVAELNDVASALHVEAEKQVRSLAAENSIQDFIISAVKDLVRESEGVAGWHLNGDIAGWDEVLPELNHSETPAKDAALREIRADGAIACGVHLREWYDYQVEERAEEFAARIRSGEQP